MANKITITVSGPPKSGKTRLLKFIKNTINLIMEFNAEGPLNAQPFTVEYKEEIAKD